MTKIIVIDTSSILAICKDDEDGQAEEAAIIGASLIAPMSVEWEVINALCQGVYKKKISRASAEKALKEYQHMRKNITFVDIERGDAVKISMDMRIMSYDAFVLQCAIENGAALLTSEKDEVNRMPHHAKALGIKLVKV